MKVVPYILYETSTGKIRYTGKSSQQTFDQGSWEPDCSLIEGEASPSIHYIENGVVQNKTPLDFVTTVNGMTVTMTGLPAGCVVRVGADELETDELPTEIEFEVAGTYLLRIDGGAKHTDENLEVTVG